MLLLADEHVVLLDHRGQPSGTLPKHAAHNLETPLHLAFSCYVVDPEGRVLLTRRAASKKTWPGVWSNACCGHPQWGESLRNAVSRRLEQELRVHPQRLDVVLPDFSYRATMGDGTVEHELCPVVVAQINENPSPNSDEVEEVAWTSWDELRIRAADAPTTLSPWSVVQINALHNAGWRPGVWPRAEELLDRPPTMGSNRLQPLAEPFAAVRPELDAILACFLDEKAEQIRSIDPELAELVQEVEGLIQVGGKRLRPAFVHWGNRAAGGNGDVQMIGAAVEMLHTFALLHDDVMDRSRRRRGRDCAHVAFTNRHVDHRMVGDSEQFGTSAAILAGDLAFAWTQELLERASLSPEAMSRVRSVFADLRTEVLAGQYLDLVLGGSENVEEDRARQVALLKSARYTVTRPLLLGAAAVSDTNATSLSRALRAYGDSVGLAFQLRDDILSLFGDPWATGKGIEEDLREGKRTLLILRALRLADRGQRELIERALGDPNLDNERCIQVREVVASTGALASVELLIGTEHARAVRAADGIPEPARGALLALADMAICRDR